MKIESYGNRELMHMGKLELHTGEVHIWKLRWRELETFWEWHKPLLEKEEYQKVKHYHFYEDQMRYLTGKIAVRMLLKEYSGVDKIVLRKGKYGKLYWKAPPGQKEITFNLSHSGEWVLTIFACQREFKYTILGIPCIEQDQYLQLPVEHLFVELGKKYAELLIKYKDYKLYFIGHCIGGLIAIETAKELLKQGTEVDLVTMISTNIYDGDDKKREENFQILQSNLILEKVFGRLIGADVRKSGFTITDTKLMEAIRVICQKGKFVEEKLVELTGEYQEVANMCQKLLESSHQERLRSLFSAREGKVRHAENKEDREVLFEIFKHNLLAALYYEVTDYCGNIKLLRCCNQTENFFINMIDGFSEDDMVWRKSKVKDIVTGEVQGDHISCMEFPYIKENINLIIEGI